MVGGGWQGTDRHSICAVEAALWGEGGPPHAEEREGGGEAECRRHSFATAMLLVVSVPVLSEQMTVVQPRVSTAGSVRTMAFRRAIFWEPRARHVVTTAGRPSGMAATARATAILR